MASKTTMMGTPEAPTFGPFSGTGYRPTKDQKRPTYPTSPNYYNLLADYYKQQNDCFVLSHEN